MPELEQEQASKRPQMDVASPLEKDTTQLTHEAGAFGIQLMTALAVQGVQMAPVARALGSIGITLPDSVLNDLAFKQWITSAALDVADEMIERAHNLVKARSSGELGCLKSMSVGSDGCYQHRKNSDNGTVLLVDTEANSTLIIAFVTFTRRTTEKEKKLGVAYFEKPAAEMEAIGLAAAIKRLDEMGAQLKIVTSDKDLELPATLRRVFLTELG
jgi:hypothetical protein